MTPQIGYVNTTGNTTLGVDQFSGVNLPSGQSTGGALAFSLFNSKLTRILNVEIDALQVDGLGKVISSPRVITANNVKAKIEDGKELPFRVLEKDGYTIKYRPAKLSLEVTPQVTPDGTVKMALVVKKEEPDETIVVDGNRAIISSVVETNVVVENGGTVVVGGVYRTEKSSIEDKVPLLGDLPGVGWLFKSRAEKNKRRELLIFITPRVISDGLTLK